MRVVAIIAGCAIFVISIFWIVTNIKSEACLARDQQRYESLISQAKGHYYENDNDLGKKQLADEIRDWNEDLASYRGYKESIWIGGFYPEKVEELEYIPYSIMDWKEG